MPEQKKELSKLCLAGFILAILTPVFLILLNTRLPKLLGNFSYWILMAAVILCPLVGFILSIVGVATAKKGGKKGKGFGIAGIVLPSVYAVVTAILVGIVALFGALFFSAISRHETDKKLPTFYSDSEVVSVRYYTREADGYRFEYLDAGRLDEFVDDLNSMELETGGMMDYYWGGSFGIEMELEDGTYLIYDGTRIELLSRRIDDNSVSGRGTIKGKSDYAYVMNYDFWEVMKGYFPSIEANGDKVFGRK